MDVIEKRKIADEADEIAKMQNKELTAMEDNLLSTLETLGLDSFKEGGYQFIKIKKYSLATPKGDDKITFFEYLKSIGQFELLATVHSRTLTSWYNEEKKNAEIRGEMLMIPGLELPTERIGLTVKKSN